MRNPRRLLKCGHACPFCSEAMQLGAPSEPTFEHLQPTSRGGAFRGRNRIVVCARCNADKGDLTLAEFRRVLVQVRDPRAEQVTAFMLARGESDWVSDSTVAVAAMRRAQGRIGARRRAPDWDDLRGAAPGATGALTSEDFVRELRDAWD